MSIDADLVSEASYSCTIFQTAFELGYQKDSAARGHPSLGHTYHNLGLDRVPKLVETAGGSPDDRCSFSLRNGTFNFGWHCHAHISGQRWEAGACQLGCCIGSFLGKEGTVNMLASLRKQRKINLRMRVFVLLRLILHCYLPFEDVSLPGVKQGLKEGVFAVPAAGVHAQVLRLPAVCPLPLRLPAARHQGAHQRRRQGAQLPAGPGSGTSHAAWEGRISLRSTLGSPQSREAAPRFPYKGTKEGFGGGRF